MRLLPLLLAALLLAPAAAARHPMDRDIVTEARNGVPIFLLIVDHGTATGTHSGETVVKEEDRVDRTTDAMNWDYSWSRTTSAKIAGGMGMIGGVGETEFSAHGELDETVQSTIRSDGYDWTLLQQRACDISADSGSRFESGLRTSVVGTLDPSGKVRLKVENIALPRDGKGHWVCTESSEWHDSEGQSGTDTPYSRRQVLSTSTFMGEDGDGGPWTSIYEFQLVEFETSISRSLSMPFSDPKTPVLHLCPSPLNNLEHEMGTCNARGTAYFHIMVGPCGALARSYSEHMAILRSVKDPDPGAPEPWVLTWGDEAAKKVEDVIDDVRMAIFMACPEKDFQQGEDEEILRVSLAYRDALVHLLRTTGLTHRGISELVEVLRSLELLGQGPPDLGMFDGAQESTNSRGQIVFTVHSPVSLRAWAEDGRYVGWDEAKGAPHIGIEGATYEGKPMGEQRITLPAGFYKLTIDEKADSIYLLNVSWESDGVAGNETILVPGVAGETVATHYAFDRLDEGGNARFDKFAARRMPTPQEFHWVDAASPFPGKAKAASGSDAAGGGADAAAPSPGASTGVAPGATADDGTQAATPAPALALVLGVLAVVALRRRR